MNRKSRLLERVLLSTAAAMLLGLSPAQAMDEANLPSGGPQRDPSRLTPMRRTTSAQRTEAALKAAERRQHAEQNGLLAPKPKHSQQELQRQLRQQLQKRDPHHRAPAPRGTPAPAAAPAPRPAGSGGSALNGAVHALLELALAQVGTADLYAGPNYALSKLPIAHCAGPGSNSAELCQQDADCTGFLPPYMIGPDIFAGGATCTGAVVPGTGIKKFVDTLAGLCPLGKNSLGNCIPIARPDTATFPGSDYYELGLRDYTTRFHSDLASGTKVRGYYQKNNVAGGLDPSGDAASNHYLGPIIIASTGRPVRVHFSNELPTSAAGGNLYVPMDDTLSGTNLGPDGLPYSQNRATIHLHGGNTPWISDGTQHQWTVPALEPTTHKKGLSAAYVPDMWFDAAGAPLDGQGGRADCRGQLTCAAAGATNDPGDGKLTFYYTNQQSGRLMFYHDHAYGITRLNVYSGEAAGYLLVNPLEENRLAAAKVPGTLGAAFDVAHMVPLVIQAAAWPASAAVAAGVLLVVACAATLSRGGALALAIGAVVTAWLTDRHGRRVLFAVLTGGAIAAAGLLPVCRRPRRGIRCLRWPRCWPAWSSPSRWRVGHRRALRRPDGDSVRPPLSDRRRVGRRDGGSRRHCGDLRGAGLATDLTQQLPGAGAAAALRAWAADR